jgi:hypothetical protein
MREHNRTASSPLFLRLRSRRREEKERKEIKDVVFFSKIKICRYMD